jgi:hypothetical protein
MFSIKRIFWLLHLLSIIVMADSKIADAFSNGNVNAEIQLFYYDINKQTDVDSYATALGGFLKYTTDTNNSVFASVRFHTSNPVGHNLNKTSTSLFDNDNNAESLNVNSEAFIAYMNSDRVVKIGNMMLDTPMMNEDTTRIVPWSYQGFTYTDVFNKETKVELYYIDKISSNTSAMYKQDSASGEIGNSGISMVSLQYSGIDGVKLQSYYYYAPELYSTFVAQADSIYRLKSGTLLCAGIQYFKSDNGGKYAQTENKYGGDDINLLGVRVSMYTQEWMVSVNYSQNFGISGIVSGYGGLAKVYTTSMIANGRGNYKPETWMLKSTYRLPFSKDSEIAMRFTNTKHKDNRGDDFDAYYFHFKHYFSDKASIYLRYENLNYTSHKSDTAYFRAIASYAF